MEHGVPRLLTQATAAAITGVSRDTLRNRFVRPGLVTVEADQRGAAYVVTASLERAIGREITCQDFLLAEQGREPARQYQRRYRHEHLTDDRRATA